MQYQPKHCSTYYSVLQQIISISSLHYTVQSIRTLDQLFHASLTGTA